DVVLIWPRRYHPLAVPPYAANATAELRDRMVMHLEKEGTLLVSAHSQGTALTFIALRTLAADDEQRAKLKRLWYATYGSHLNGLYALLFPCHFHDLAIGELGHAVAEWRNFWRRTDPIGGPLILADRQPYRGFLVPGDSALPDVICDDPPMPLPGPWTYV